MHKVWYNLYVYRISSIHLEKKVMTEKWDEMWHNALCPKKKRENKQTQT